MSLERVIGIARGELGYREDPPGSNRVKYGEAYGLNGVPWCVIFLWWLFREAGESKAFFGGGKTASCTVLRRWYREQGRIVSPEEARAGDIVILNFSGTKESQHCGLVTEGYSGGEVATIEGNTAVAGGSQDSGGMVCRKTRRPSQIVAVCRPQYSETKDDATGHWAEEAVRRCVRRGLMKGYPDGSLRPDGSVTRGELAVILERLEESK